MSALTRSFVLLYHTLSDNPHWDLCLDLGDRLATWQITADPTAAPAPTTPIPARRIADHRRAYLAYEGPVSGDRGEVRRVDRGVWQMVRESPESWLIRLDGSRMRGLWELPTPEGGGAMRCPGGS